MEKKTFYETPTQVKFQELDGGICYGIAFEDNIICGCCGGVFPIDEEITILERYNFWVPLHEEIKGAED